MAAGRRPRLPWRAADADEAGGLAGARRRRIAIEAALVLCGSALLAIALTWPLVRDFSTDILGGGGGGDPSGYVYDVWFNSEYGLNLWGTDVNAALSAPFGREAPGSINLLQIVFLGPAWLVSLAAGPVAGANASLLLGMTLGPAAMYLLVRWIGAGVAAAAWAAVAFAVFPNALIRATAHYPLALLACFPLLFLALWRWLERPCLRRSLWVAAASAFCWLTNPYYGVMSLLAVAVVGVAGAVLHGREDWAAGGRRVAELGGAVVAIVLVPLAAMFWATRDAVETGLTRTRLDLDIYGARLTDYLLPDAGHEVFADVFGAGWAEVGAPGGERANFLGYGTMALALLGLALAVRHRRTLSRRLRIVVLTAPPMAAVLVWFSLATPTRWLGVTIPTPSDALFAVLPFLRAYARFAVPVTALVICVAAVGLHLALRGRRPAITAVVVAPLIAVALLELPPGGGLPLTSGPPVVVAGREAGDVGAWAWLRDEAPDDATVHAFPSYPNELVERYHMYAQTVHGLAITNGDPQSIGTGSDATSAAADPRWPGAASFLRTLGADYVTVVPELYALQGVAPPDVGDPPPGFEVVRAFPDGSAVWRVTAPPRDGLGIVDRISWWTPSRRGGRNWRFMRDDAVVHLYAREAGRHRVGFRARSAGRPRELVVETGGEPVLATAVGAERGVELELELPAGRTDLRLVNPGYSAHDIPSGDARAWSFEVSDMTLALDG